MTTDQEHGAKHHTVTEGQSVANTDQDRVHSKLAATDHASVISSVPQAAADHTVATDLPH